MSVSKKLLYAGVQVSQKSENWTVLHVINSYYPSIFNRKFRPRQTDVILILYSVLLTGWIIQKRSEYQLSIREHNWEEKYIKMPGIIFWRQKRYEEVIYSKLTLECCYARFWFGKAKIVRGMPDLIPKNQKCAWCKILNPNSQTC